MSNLTDSQRILLSNASQRASGSLYPLPAALRPGGGVAKSVTALIARDLVERRETGDPAAVNERDGDVGYGVFVTDQGLAAIGIESAAERGTIIKPDATLLGATASAPAAGRAAGAKIGTVITFLKRTEGATIAELIEATGWLPHSARAALTGLRKKGHTIVRGKRGELTCYSIANVSTGAGAGTVA